MLKGKFDLTGQSANIPTTVLVANPTVGLWQISYSLVCTTPQSDNPDVYGVALFVNWFDDTDATPIDLINDTQTAARLLTSVGRTNGSVIAYVTGGDITIATDKSGNSYGTAAYALHMSAVFLG